MSNVSDHLVNLKGKAYLQVAGRIIAFRAEYPIDGDRPGRIVTYKSRAHDGRVEYRAEVYIGDALVATGHAEEPSKYNSGFISGRVAEKFETSAIGRALGCAGFGTSKAFELDEADENGDPVLADAPVAAPAEIASKPDQTADKTISQQKRDLKAIRTLIDSMPDGDVRIKWLDWLKTPRTPHTLAAALDKIKAQVESDG